MSGIEAAFAYQQRLFRTNAVSYAKLPAFGSLYTEHVASNIQRRNLFLQTLFVKFTPTPRRRGGNNGFLPLGLLRFLTQVIASLPFSKEEEPLFIIHIINRTVPRLARCVYCIDAVAVRGVQRT